MCNKHSFVMDRKGKCYNGGGFAESHSLICRMWGLEQDKVNAYEWAPPAQWPSEEWTAGFKKDQLNFEEKSSHVDALERYIRATFPTRAAWDGYRNYEMHGHRFKDGDTTIIVLACQPTLVAVKDGEACWASDSANVRAYGRASVEVSGSANVEAYGRAFVRASGNANVEVSGSASAEASDSAIVRASGNATVWAFGSAAVEVFDNVTVDAFGSATVKAFDRATVRAFDRANVKAYGSATVRAYGKATVRAFDRATVEVFGSANIIKPCSYGNRASVTLADMAVLIDRSDSGKVTIQQASNAGVQPDVSPVGPAGAS